MDNELKLRRAKKIVDSGGSINNAIPLAQLTENIITNDKLDILLEKDFPEEIEITLQGVEYIKGDKGERGDVSEYPQEVSISNLPEVQRVEVINLPSEKDDKETQNLLKELIVEVKKKEEYSYNIEVDPALKEQLKGEKGEDGKDGENGNNLTAEELRDKLESLIGENRIDKSAIKGLEGYLAQVSKGGSFTLQGYLNFTQQNKTFVYNPDGTLLSMSDENGSKTFTYSSGLATSMVGDGWYKSKSFAYSSGKLTNVNLN